MHLSYMTHFQGFIQKLTCGGVNYRGGAVKLEGTRVGGVFLGRGSEPPLHQLGGLGKRCKLRM